MAPRGLVRQDGWLVPEHDLQKRLPRRVKEADGLGMLAGQCAGRRVAVQAGGNVGVWPAHLSDLFEVVYTFEPEPLNFAALAINTANVANMIRLQAALGDRHGCVGLSITKGNSGMARVDGAGQVPMLMIDDLALDVCDALVLDIEGYEVPALRGARATIERCRPVILLEDKGHGERYGHGERGATTHFAEGLGYSLAARLGKDVLLVARGRK